MIRTKDSLAELIQSEEFHPYLEANDPRHKDIHWHVFGDCRYGLLWIVLSNLNTGEQAIECILSRVHAPPMKERVFGLDEGDAALAQTHTEYMWNKYHKKLIP